jgi:sensor histidine kinase regulating citrate/malate metabolism
MQTAIIISRLFIMICRISVIIAVMINTRYLSQKRELSVISLTNDLMEKNYIQISQQQQQVSKLLHDFTNHLKTIDQLLLTNSSAKEYVQNLLTDVSEPLQLCQSGNKIIDAVINCKNEEAIRNRIQFSYQIRLSDHPLQITSTDLCALLANQIDNAIEACQKIADTDKRHIFISIWQREAFVFFRVINSTSVNPLDENRKIKIVGSSKGELHGFGIKNMHDITQRYNGTLEMSHADGNFTSLAILQSIE